MSRHPSGVRRRTSDAVTLRLCGHRGLGRCRSWWRISATHHFHWRPWQNLCWVLSTMIQLSFTEKYRYKDDPSGITIPVLLLNGSKSVRVAAKVDTGSVVCRLQPWRRP